MKASKDAIEALKVHEGFRARMYFDQAGLPTIGYGTLIDTPEEQYLRTATITEAQAEDLLRRDLAKFEQVVNDTITVPLTQNQFDALLLFVYNVGPGGFRNGSLPRLINGKADPLAISAKWREYRMAGGQVSNGLVKRRREELNLYWRHLWTLGLVLFVTALVALGTGTILLLA